MISPDLPEQLFRDLIDAASDFVGTVDRLGNIVYINPAGRRLLEIPLDEDIVGQSILPYNEAPTDVLSAAARILVDTNEHWTGMSMFVSRTGRRIPMSQMMVAHCTDGRSWYSTIAREITAQLQREDDLQYRADHDALTGLLNRRAFRSRVQELSFSTPTAVAMIDLDHFKSVNDTLGHQTGDELLQVIGRQLLDTTKRHGLSVRLGGDEFAVVIESVDETDVGKTLARLDADLQRAAGPYGTSVSVGYAPLSSADGLDGALRVADAALYESKRLQKLAR